MGIMSHNFSLQ